MNKQFKIAWSKEPEKDDYRAAEKYLTLTSEAPMPSIDTPAARRMSRASYFAIGAARMRRTISDATFGVYVAHQQQR